MPRSQVTCHTDGTEVGHAIVYDAWRSLLFIGAGDWNTRQTNGVLMIEDEDKSDPSKVLEYLHLHFGVQDVLEFAYIVLVNKKRVAETSHV